MSSDSPDVQHDTVGTGLLQSSKLLVQQLRIVRRSMNERSLLACRQGWQFTVSACLLTGPEAAFHGVALQYAELVPCYCILIVSLEAVHGQGMVAPHLPPALQQQ